MIITKKHAVLIQRMLKRWEGGLPLEKVVDELTEEDLRYLNHLELAGLVEEAEDSFDLTQAGHLVAEAIGECVKAAGEVENWSEDFRLVGSEVISMIEIARACQSNIADQDDVASELEKRGLAKEGRLTPVAESILQAYDISDPRIYITPQLAEGLRKTPPGPGKKTLLPFTKDEIFRLEAMRLLAFSVPFGNTYSLTGPGQQIRAGLLKGAVVDFALIDAHLYPLIDDTASPEEVTELVAMGAVDYMGDLLPAGEHLKKAAELLYKEPITINPSIDIDQEDFTVLEAIDELWKKHAQDPEIYPSSKQIRRHLEDRFNWQRPLSYPLYLLESFRLVESEAWERGGLIYHLTEWGREVLAESRDRNGPVYSTAVMALTTTRMENLSPDDNWCRTAEKQGLLGNGYPTKSGRLFSQLASGIDRLPVISSLEAGVLGILPLWRGMFESAILSRFPEDQKEDVRRALRKLISQALVDALPGGLYTVTEAGERFKRGVSAVPPGAELPVTPHLLRLLSAAASNLENGKINLKATEKASRLDPEVFRDVLLQAEKFHFIRAGKITSAGRLLIEGLELLENVKTRWREIEV